MSQVQCSEKVTNGHASKKRVRGTKIQGEEKIRTVVPPRGKYKRVRGKNKRGLVGTTNAIEKSRSPPKSTMYLTKVNIFLLSSDLYFGDFGSIFSLEFVLLASSQFLVPRAGELAQTDSQKSVRPKKLA